MTGSGCTAYRLRRDEQLRCDLRHTSRIKLRPDFASGFALAPVLFRGVAEMPAAFPEVFRGLAAKYGDLLYPDFKEGVTGHSELIGRDGDHANSAGEAIVVERMLPSVLELIDRVEKP